MQFNEKETLVEVFSCEFCEILKNTFFTKNLWKTASSVVVRRALLFWLKSSTTNFTLLLHRE